MLCVALIWLSDTRRGYDSPWLRYMFWKFRGTTSCGSFFEKINFQDTDKLHQRRKLRGAPARSSSAGSAVDRFVEIVWCCLHHHGCAAPPQRARCRRPQRSLMERFFCGSCRKGECWLGSAYRSMTQCRKMGPPHIGNCARTRASINTWPARKTFTAPVGRPTPRWCKCALTNANVW